MNLKHYFVPAVLALTSLCAAAQDVGTPPARTATVGTQKSGDLVIQGTVTPTWFVPGGRAVPFTQEQAQPFPVTPKQSREAVQSPESQKRLSSNEWRQRAEALAGDIEAGQMALNEAKESLVTAAQDELRKADDQLAAAQRKLDAARRQAESTAKYASNLDPKTTPVTTAVATTVVPAAVPVSPPVEPVKVAVQPGPIFELLRQDRTIAAALTRWSEVAAYSLLWEVKDESVSYEDRYTSTFPDAVDKVIKNLRIAGKDVRMCEYTNKVIRIVTQATPCKISPQQNQATVIGAAE